MLLTLVLSSFLMQADIDPQTVQEEIRIEYVLLDILATDRKGNPITDLTLDDFEIKESRKKVKVTNFEKFDLRSSEDVTFTPEMTEQIVESGGPDEPTAPTTVQTQKIIFLMDMEDLTNPEVAFSMNEIKKYIDDLEGVLDYQVDLRTMEYGSFTEGLTSSRGDIERGLGAIRERYIRDNVMGGGRSDSILDGLERSRGDRARTRAGGLADLEEAFDDCKDFSPDLVNCIYAEYENFMELHYLRTRRALGEMVSVVQHYKEEPGLKQIMMVSPGFTINGISAARELRDIALGVSTGPTGMMRDGAFDNDEIQNEYRALLHLCLANRIIVHSFDIYNRKESFKRQTGAEWANRASSNLQSIYTRFNMEVTDGMREVSDQTGGNFMQGFGLVSSVNRTIQRGRFFYQLGYTSPDGKPGKWRKIKIKVKRKGVKLQYRKGYFGS